MDSVCESSRCTGCGMCSDICPKDAINLKEGLNGFIYPSINNNSIPHTIHISAILNIGK